MSLESAVRGVREEAGSIVATLREQFASLDLSTDYTLAVRDKYNLITRDVLGLSYGQVVEGRSLPPVDPSTLFDQVRLGSVGITALGDIFFPSLPAENNLKTLQEFYTSVGGDIDLVAQQLSAHPPGIPSSESFDLAVNRFSVTAISSRNADGALKTREEIATELGRENFDLFLFPDVPLLYYLVIPEYLGLNLQLSAVSRQLDIPVEQLSCQTTWFGSINPSSANFSKMKVTYGLSNPQVRAASFGDDLAVSSSSSFFRLLDVMEARFNFVGSSLPESAELVKILNAVQQDALTFLAQATFVTTLIVDRDVVANSDEAGVERDSLEFSLVNRSDPGFAGANLEANSLVSTVFPAKDNSDERKALSFALQQDTDTPRFTNVSLNLATDYRENVVNASKRLVASLSARSAVIATTPNQQTTTQALLDVLADIEALRDAYETFLSPPIDITRKLGTKTTESANNYITRACNLVASLRIKDQINEFPVGFDGEVADHIQLVLGSLASLANSIETYLSLYRTGDVRDFLAAVVSVSSMTNFLLAGGEPDNSLIVTEFPAGIGQLRNAIQTVLLDDEAIEVLYDSVFLQVGEFASVLRGTQDNDPVGRLLDLPISVLDALLPSDTVPTEFSLTLEGDQEPALRQIRDSFDVLRRTVGASLRDLGTYGTNFGCALNDAKFFIARLSGDSVRNLVVELRQF